MTDRPTSPPKKRRGIVNADVPSETLATGLPDVGEGASAAQFASDTMPFQAGERAEPGAAAPTDPDNRDG